MRIMTKNTCAAVLLLLLVAAVAALPERQWSSSSAPLKRAEVSYFYVTPQVVAEGQAVEFILGMKNAGNTPLTVEPVVELRSAGQVVERLGFVPVRLEVGQNLSIVRGYIAALPPGNYRAVLKLYSNGTLFASKEASLGVITGIRREFALKNESPGIRFTFHPVLIEGKPGSACAFSFEVANPSAETVALTASLGGLPERWVSIKPRAVSIPTGETAGINVAVSVPESALPGEHAAVLRLEGSEEAALGFLFRILPYPERLELPAVMRRVYAEAGRGRVQVELEVENSGREAELIELIEEVPEGRIIPGSPKPQVEGRRLIWRFRQVDPYETRMAEYEIAGIDNLSEFTRWTFFQMNIYYKHGVEELEFSGGGATYALPGGMAEVVIKLANPTPEAMNVSVELLPPEHWVAPPPVSVLLLPGEEKEMSFEVRVPADVQPGSYTLTAVVRGRRGEISQPLTIVVQEKRERNLRGLAAALLGLGAVALLVYALKLIYRRKTRRRELVKAVGRIRRSMEEER